jgi:hypothetical protein
LSHGFQWRIRGAGYTPAKIPVAALHYGELSPSIQTKKPFFNILTESSTVKLFLDAVARDDEYAKCLLSKNCIKNIDLLALKETFINGGFKVLFGNDSVSAVPGSKNCRTNTVLLINNKQRTILRLYMVREPDQFGQWKIFSVEKE